MKDDFKFVKNFWSTDNIRNREIVYKSIYYIHILVVSEILKSILYRPDLTRSHPILLRLMICCNID